MAYAKPAYGEAKQALIEAAIRLVARAGLSKLTYRSLAAEAGVAAGAVQYNFASMQDVLECALEHSMQQSVARSVDVNSVPDFVDAIVNFLREEPDIMAFSVELFVAARHSPSIASIVQEQQENYRELNRELLRTSSIGYDEALVEFIMASVDGIVLQAVSFTSEQQARTELQFNTLKWVIANYEHQME